MNVTRTLGLGALLTLFAAVTAQDVRAQNAPGSRNPGGVVVVVQNNGFYDQHVYAVQGGQRRTIGLVTGLTTQTLELPRVMAETQQDIQVLALPIAGGSTYLSQMLAVYPGDQVNVTLHTDATYSSTTVSDQEAEEPETTPDDAPDTGSPIQSD
jgi:hypothetical protein